MTISHRLRSPMFERADDGINEEPKRIVFLSVEGSVTEKNYFDCINRYKEAIGVQSVVFIETLARTDTRSDPGSVLQLLEELCALREGGLSADDLYELISETGQTTTKEQIKQYIDNQLEGEDLEGFSDILDTVFRLKGIDLKYQKYLSDFKGENTNDVFGVVIDRDCGSHSEKGMNSLILECKRKGYGCYITNPCFEFWLLMHVCDIKEELKGNYTDIQRNAKVSNKHTFVSNELSKRAGHSKWISDCCFRKHYLPNIDLAIKRSECFETNEEKLIHRVGTNLPSLFAVLRETI